MLKGTPKNVSQLLWYISSDNLPLTEKKWNNKWHYVGRESKTIEYDNEQELKEPGIYLRIDKTYSRNYGKEVCLDPFVKPLKEYKEAELSGNKYSQLVEEFGKKTGYKVMKICAQIEAEVAGLETEIEKKEFLESVGLAETGLSQIIRNSYELWDPSHNESSNQLSGWSEAGRIGMSA